MRSRHRKDVTNMGGLDFYLVDVFAEEKYAGNQLAVVKNARARAHTSRSGTYKSNRVEYWYD